MFQVINHKGKTPNQKSVTIIIQKQNSEEKQFNFSLGGISTFEVADMVKSTINQYEDKINKSAVFEILNAIKELSTEREVHKLINELFKKLRGEL